jgi:hypothetical protein
MYSVDDAVLSSVESGKCTHRERYSRYKPKDTCATLLTKDSCLSYVNSLCDENLAGTKGSEYKGCQSKTRTGKTCSLH